MPAGDAVERENVAGAELSSERQRRTSDGKPLTDKWRPSNAKQLISYRARQQGRRRGKHTAPGLLCNKTADCSSWGLCSRLTAGRCALVGNRAQTAVPVYKQSYCQVKHVGEGQLQLVLPSGLFICLQCFLFCADGCWC